MATSEQNKFTLGNPPSILIDYDLGKVIHNCKKPTDSKTLYESISEIALNVDTPVICLSGGGDSQFNFMLFKELGIEFEVVSYATKWGINTINADDVLVGDDLCKKYNVKRTVIDIDLQQFLETKEYIDVAEKYGTYSPQIALHIKFLSKIQDLGTPVLGDEPPLMRMNSGVPLLGLDTNGMARTLEGYNNFRDAGNKYFRNLLYATPEIFYKSVENNVTTVKEQKVYNETTNANREHISSHRYKYCYYNTILKDLQIESRLIKSTGFETVQKYFASLNNDMDSFDREYRYNLLKNSKNLQHFMTVEGNMYLQADNFSVESLTKVESIWKGNLKDLKQEYMDAISKYKPKNIFDYML